MVATPTGADNRSGNRGLSATPKPTDTEHAAQYLYRRYTVGIEFLSGIAGGQPLNHGLVAAHIARFAEDVSNDLKLSRKNNGEVTEEAMQKYMLACSSGFNLGDRGIYIRGFQFNAMLKDAAQRIKATMKTKGLGHTLRDGGLLFPDRIYLGVDPHVVERPVKPDNGPANIKIFQVAEVPAMTVPCAVLENGDLPDDLFRQVWVVAQGMGLGANRHLGYGRFSIRSIKQEGDWNIADLFRSGMEVLANGGASPVPETIDAVPSPAS